MAIDEHITEFAGMPVEEWDEAAGVAGAAGKMWRVSVSYDEAEEGTQWTDKFAAFLEADGVAEVEGIVVGPWGEVASGDDSARIVEALVAAHARLPRLRAIFFGDIVVEESEISWIRQSDMSPLLDAFPQLEHFCVRGGEGLILESPRHRRLKTLIVQTGGLPADVVRGLGAAELPELEHLELWLGEPNYGGDATAADLEPILSGRLFPKLRYLGLKDSEIQDEVAATAATAPITSRIRVLDLSMGTLSDAGAAALLASPAVARLEKLDLHHHFMSPEMTAKIERLGIDVDVSERNEPDSYRGETWRYIAVSE